MVDGKGVVEQAHEIECMVKELELLKIVVPYEFVARDIIAKFPPSYREFATILKHKRTHMSIPDLNASLDIEEKTRSKDRQSKGVEGQISCETPSVTVAATVSQQYPHHVSTVLE
jgi:hypothetical protein